MAGSSADFPWTTTLMEIALHNIFDVWRQLRDDPLDENNLIQAAFKLHARTYQTAECVPLQHVTTNDLRALMHDRRQLYHRVCELANHHSMLGFSSKTFQIMMSPDKYVSYIRAFPRDEELISKGISHFFYVYVLRWGCHARLA